MAQQPLESQGLLIYEASQSHSGAPHSVGVPRTCYQPNVETSPCNHITLTSEAPMSRAGFQSAVSAIQWPQTQALDRSANGIGLFYM